MMLPSRPAPGGRPGLSLLEVLVALAIFLISLIAIGQLITLGGERAVDGQQHGRAAQLCQSKLAEVVAGAVPLTSQSEVPFDEDPNWVWSLDCTQADAPGLWNVQVRVIRQRSDGTQVERSLSQMVLDPSLRGSTMDSVAIAGSDAASGGTSTSSSTGPSGASATPAATPAPAAPAATTPAAPTTTSPAAPKSGSSATKGGK
jgi:general secretion pathway protein I